jgi:sarcosine oxidase gamma subunit
MLRGHAGIIDVSSFAKYEVEGPGAEAWLNALFANRMPTQVGRSCLTPLIGKRGGIAGDFTVTKLTDDAFMVFGSGMAERFHQRFFKAVPLPEGTTFRSLTEELCGFNVAGPKSRELLQRLTNADLSTQAFPFMRSCRITVAGVDVVALRVSFTGDLGWEHRGGSALGSVSVDRRRSVSSVRDQRPAGRRCKYCYGTHGGVVEGPCRACGCGRDLVLWRCGCELNREGFVDWEFEASLHE